jgi:putative endonuclease
MYTVYILYSRRLDHYYVGQTSDIEIRLARHNSGLVRWTSQGVPWKMVYTESYATRSEAVERERFIKSRKSRVFIEKLIRGTDLLNGRVPRSGINH